MTRFLRDLGYGMDVLQEGPATVVYRLGHFIVCCVATVTLPVFALVYLWQTWRCRRDKGGRCC